MKNRMVVMALLFLCALSTSAQQPDSTRPMMSTLRLMPVPAAVQLQTGQLKIDASFTTAVDGFTDGRLQGAIHRMARRLEGRT